MKTQIERARENSITPQMETVARDEGLPVEPIRERVANDTCTMCGDFCAMKKGMEVFQKDIAGDKLSTPK